MGSGSSENMPGIRGLVEEPLWVGSAPTPSGKCHPALGLKEVDVMLVRNRTYSCKAAFKF